MDLVTKSKPLLTDVGTENQKWYQAYIDIISNLKFGAKQKDCTRLVSKITKYNNDYDYKNFYYFAKEYADLKSSVPLLLSRYFEFSAEKYEANINYENLHICNRRAYQKIIEANFKHSDFDDSRYYPTINYEKFYSMMKFENLFYKHTHLHFLLSNVCASQELIADNFKDTLLTNNDYLYHNINNNYRDLFQAFEIYFETFSITHIFVVDFLISNFYQQLVKNLTIPSKVLYETNPFNLTSHTYTNVAQAYIHACNDFTCFLVRALDLKNLSLFQKTQNLIAARKLLIVL